MSQLYVDMDIVIVSQSKILVFCVFEWSVVVTVLTAVAFYMFALLVEMNGPQSNPRKKEGGVAHTQTNKAEIDNNPHLVESLVFACLIKER